MILKTITTSYQTIIKTLRKRSSTRIHKQLKVIIWTINLLSQSNLNSQTKPRRET